jgi:hypothetical protein
MEQMENGKIVIFDRSDGGEDDQTVIFPQPTSKILTSPTRRIVPV